MFATVARHVVVGVLIFDAQGGRVAAKWPKIILSQRSIAHGALPFS